MNQPMKKFFLCAYRNISSCVRIVCKRLSDVSLDDVVMTVLVDGEYNSNNSIFNAWGTVGYTNPLVNGVEATLLQDKTNDNWTSSVIYISTAGMELNNSSVSYMQAIVMHEVGHALKLTHPLEEAQISNKGTFPSVMHVNQIGILYGNYLDSLEYKPTICITNYDKSALKYKWENLIR